MSGRVVRWPLRERVNDRGKPVTVHEGRFVPAHHAVDETTASLKASSDVGQAIHVSFAELEQFIDLPVRTYSIKNEGLIVATSHASVH